MRTSLDPESWDALFDFVDPSRAGKSGGNRDAEAEANYHAITRKLVVYFAARGCRDAEDLATETVLRVASKCRTLSRSEYRDHAGYFFGVAQNVFHEWQRGAIRESTLRQSVSREPTLVAPGPTSGRKEIVQRCLDQCVTALPSRPRELIVKYYGTESANRIEVHRKLAADLGKSVNALRIEVHRIRKILQQCVLACVHPGGTGAASKFAFAGE